MSRLGYVVVHAELRAAEGHVRTCINEIESDEMRRRLVAELDAARSGK